MGTESQGHAGFDNDCSDDVEDYAEAGTEARDWLIDWTLFLNGKDISTTADSHICRCYNTTNNQDIHSEILLQRALGWEQ